MKSVDATEFRVGGSDGWTVTTSFNYNQWAEKNRFQVGDSLLFDYDSGKDSVYQVNKEDYDKCHTEKPIETYKDGHTSIKLDETGTLYFISGNCGNCRKNEKMVVQVMACRGSCNSAASLGYLSCLGVVGAFVASLLL
ncbi:Early nodulin-like protein [Thalictrum thalictroides]|uniref:Early nodulin-like protein n=1 Tax=Thalictrum thalictroides TaxID=46969 RepID=A0A7J6UWL6_THATH|nr:Early nodulin-like protein [Thalictrum thalictroides]